MHNAILKCYELNAAFGNSAPDALQLMNAEHSEQVQLAKNVFGQCHGVIEETLELAKSTTVVPALDALGDLVTFLHGIPLKCGVYNAKCAQLFLSSVCAAARPELEDPMSIDWLVYTISTEWEDFCDSMLVVLDDDDVSKVNHYGFADSVCMCPAHIAVSAALSFWAKVTAQLFDFAVSNKLDIGSVYDRVHTSNMTKLAPTVEQAQAAIQAYCDKYNLSPSDFTVRTADNKNYAIYAACDLMMGTKPVPENKFLKCLDFKEPVFEGVEDRALVGSNKLLPQDFAPVGSPFVLECTAVYGCDDVLPPRATGAGTIAMLHRPYLIRRPESNLARFSFDNGDTGLLVNVRADESGFDYVDVYECCEEEGAIQDSIRLPFKLFLRPIGQEALQAIADHIAANMEGFYGEYRLTEVKANEHDWLYKIPSGVSIKFPEKAAV